MVMLNAMPQIELDATENEFRMTVRTMVFVTERVTKAVFPIGEKYTSELNMNSYQSYSLKLL